MMNEQDKRAFEEFKERRSYTEGKDWVPVTPEEWFLAGVEYARGKQEPVAWVNYSPTDGGKWYSDMQENIDSEPLYTTPQAQPVQPAVNEQLLEALKEASKTFEQIAWKRPLDSQPTKREIIAEKLALAGRGNVDRVIRAAEAAKGEV